MNKHSWWCERISDEAETRISFVITITNQVRSVCFPSIVFSRQFDKTQLEKLDQSIFQSRSFFVMRYARVNLQEPWFVLLAMCCMLMNWMKTRKAKYSNLSNCSYLLLQARHLSSRNKSIDHKYIHSKKNFFDIDLMFERQAHIQW